MRSIAIAAAAMAVVAGPAAARTVSDCPLRDAPFSIESPLVDLLLSPSAKAVLAKAAPGRLDKLPPGFAGTEPPTFAAILTLKGASGLTGLKLEALPAIDAELRAIPITDADRAARCARYDDDPVSFSVPKGMPAVLLFDKINGFRDGPSVNAARAAFEKLAEQKGWTIVSTDKGGAIRPETLRQFDAVIWNNVSGDVLTLAQRKALKSYIENGGGFLAVHGSAGDPVYFWDWYADTLIGARFKGHPMGPQFQDARVVVEDRSHPIAAKLPSDWVMNDEWYSFRTNPRAAGAHVILRLDESSYKPEGMGQDLRMGDHPIAWTNCIGKGRAFYSAIGHRPEVYAAPQHLALLDAALDWTALDRKACPPARAARQPATAR
ncbi:ThuA domain-containing protein [Phenylobacterium sp. LjRoot225]|uniref:ThuA domain-containing protein n=1 Tax=Phenylobacterium sp. LjRoot225 TaxID=3342285 RepID=UPI003ECDE633